MFRVPVNDSQAAGPWAAGQKCVGVRSVGRVHYSRLECPKMKPRSSSLSLRAKATLGSSSVLSTESARWKFMKTDKLEKTHQFPRFQRKKHKEELEERVKQQYFAHDEYPQLPARPDELEALIGAVESQASNASIRVPTAGDVEPPKPVDLDSLSSVSSDGMPASPRIDFVDDPKSSFNRSRKLAESGALDKAAVTKLFPLSQDISRQIKWGKRKFKFKEASGPGLRKYGSWFMPLPSWAPSEPGEPKRWLEPDTRTAEQKQTDEDRTQHESRNKRIIPQLEIAKRLRDWNGVAERPPAALRLLSQSFHSGSMAESLDRYKTMMRTTTRSRNHSHRSGRKK